MTTSTVFPQTYEQWHHCITQECRIALTAAFVADRLAVWRNAQAEETVRFRTLYGDDYLTLIIGFFERAEKELGAASQTG